MEKLCLIIFLEDVNCFFFLKEEDVNCYIIYNDIPSKSKSLNNRLKLFLNLFYNSNYLIIIHFTLHYEFLFITLLHRNDFFYHSLHFGI